MGIILKEKAGRKIKEDFLGHAEGLSERRPNTPIPQGYRSDRKFVPVVLNRHLQSMPTNSHNCISLCQPTAVFWISSK